MAIDIIARGMIESSNGNISQLSEKVSNHTDNSDIHVTASDKENWNSHPNDVTATGNPVQLDGLQGGVPFSEITVSGKNLIGIAQAKVLGGNENGGYNVIDSPYSRTISQKLQPNTTYTVKKYDSGNRFRIVLFNNEPSTAADITAKQLVINTNSSITEYTFTTDTAHLWFAFTTHSATSGDAVEPIVQLEYGSTVTAYEPPITGRELTVNVCGKNLIPTDYMANSGTYRGVTVTVKDDGRVDLSGTATSEGYILDILSNFHLIGGKKYTFSCSKQYDVNTFNLGFVIRDKNGVWKYGQKSYPATIIADEGDYISAWRLWTYTGVEYSAENVEIQMEIGDTATEYETPVGSKITITPDSNPYIIPNDIRQLDGLNTISVSAGTLSVTGVRKNAAIKRIWDSVGMDLLFDGITSADAPAVVDLAGYDAIEIHHIIVASGVAYPVHIKMPVSDYVNTEFTRISSPITNSFIITYVTNTDSHISDVYAASAGGALMLNTKIYGIKE